MTTTITPVSQATAALPPRAVAGERMMMDGGTAPLKDIIQNLYDRTEYADNCSSSRLEWSGDFSVDPGGSNSSFVVNIGAIQVVSLVDASGVAYKPFLYAGGTIGASKIEGGGNLANSIWYYVYCYPNAGVLDFEISTSGPRAHRVYKSPVTTATYARRYLGCFKTDSAGAPIPVVASRGHYVYDVGGVALSDLQVITSGVDASYTMKSCAALVPPHARIARLFVTLLANVAPAIGAGVSLQRNGSAAAGAHTIVAGQTALEVTTGEVDLPLDTSQRLQYKVTGGANAPTVDGYVFGFRE